MGEDPNLKPHLPHVCRQVGRLDVRFPVSIRFDLIETCGEPPPTPRVAIGSQHARIQESLVKVEDDRGHDGEANPSVIWTSAILGETTLPSNSAVIDPEQRDRAQVAA